MHRFARLPAAVLVLAGGLVHLQLWQGGYQDIPYIGPLFLVNVGASGLIAVALAVRGGRWVTLAGVTLAAGSLLALVTSRSVGLLGFMEGAWTPAAIRTIAAEVGAIVAIGLIVATDQRNRALARIPVLVDRPERRRQG